MSTNTGVPGIPIGALDAISDENTRIVLQALVDGWHLRNGNTGTGDNAFLTKGEADLMVANAAGQQVTQQIGALALSPGNISKALDDLHTQVFNSFLFKTLEARVDYIDKPGGIFDRLGAAEVALVQETTQRIAQDGAISNRIDAMGTRVGLAEAAIITETNQRVNSDTAIQSTITTQYAAVNESLALQQTAINTNANGVAALVNVTNQLQAQINDNKVAIAQESSVRANVDGDLYAQWTLRVDVNGRISGFGLASDATSSDFIVRADRFSIVSPNGNYAAVIMTNNTINVYDENGALRVRIGNLLGV